MHFWFDLNLELHRGLKVRASEINFFILKMLHSKYPYRFIIKVLEVGKKILEDFLIRATFIYLLRVVKKLTGRL